MKMIENKLLEVLKTIYERLKATEVRWMILGSMNLALQGLPLSPNDIDIYTDERGAYEIEEIFVESVVRKVCYSSTERIRSYFGELNIDGVKVEVMGNLEIKDQEGKWIGKDFKCHIVTIERAGMKIPVLSLEHERQGYLNLGRAERAQQIQNWLERNAIM